MGFDRETELIYRIDPLLRACLPPNPPAEQDVRAAVTYLFDEWLVDVALDRVGKSMAIMLAMTLIERALLPERPAFFVTAGQRGGGKTTLVNMLTLAALGRRAAAAGWSDDGEERKKALFSYLRQSVACLAWDNISRGSAISCPHLQQLSLRQHLQVIVSKCRRPRSRTYLVIKSGKWMKCRVAASSI